MNGPFIQRIIELSGKSEQELAAAAFDEFKRLSLQSSDVTLSLQSIENSFALLAIALKWIDKPRVYTRVMSDGVQPSDSLG